MIENFTKADKKAARMVIDLALQRDFSRILEEYHELLSKWKAEHPADNSLAYRTFYQAVHNNDQYISKTYDSLTGSRYFTTIVGLLIEGILSERDLAGFSTEARAHLLKTVTWLKKQ